MKGLRCRAEELGFRGCVAREGGFPGLLPPARVRCCARTGTRRPRRAGRGQATRGASPPAPCGRGDLRL